MPRHVVAKASELTPGTRKLVTIEGKAVLVLNVGGELFALSDTCPHKGASLSGGLLTGLVRSAAPGCYDYTRSGEMLRCPWHGWEYDIRTGRSYCDPRRMRLMSFPVTVADGASLVQGPYTAETFPVDVEGDYVVVEA